MAALTTPEHFNRIFANHKPAEKKRKTRGQSRRPAGMAVPMIRRDDMPAMRSMGDGKMYDSKSAYYNHLKQDGLEIVDSKPEKPVVDDAPVVTGHDVKEAVAQTVAELGGGAI
jgi:hypothetical protein